MREILLRIVLPVVIACIAMSGGMAAEPYPAKPIRMISLLPPGPDAFIRVIATRLAEQIGQPVVVENRVGGSGVPAAQAVMNAPADGYTLLFYTVVLIISKSIQPNLVFDPVADFAPVAKIYGGGASLLLVRPDAPFKSAQELIDRARAAPGKITHGGVYGLSGHLNAASFLALAGAKGFHVPFKATGDDLPAILRGDIDFTFQASTVAMPQVQGGKFRVLAATSGERMRVFPDVPTAKEILKNDLMVQDNWSGFAVHAKTPPAIIRRLHAETGRLLQDAAVRKVLEASGNQVSGEETSEQFGQFMRREFDKWREIVKLTGVKVE